jgi:hypothetical protein
MKQPDSQIQLPIGHEVPKGAKLLNITSGYEDLPEAIPCGLSTCHARHRKGFVVEFLGEDGQRGEGMLGHMCGAKHFGDVDWKRQMKEHRARERLVTLKIQIRTLIEDCEQLLPLIEPLASLADTIDKSRRTLQSDATDLYRICENACRQNNGLISCTGRDGKTMEIRLRSRGFWIRPELLPRIKRLLGDLRGFPDLARGATSVDRLNTLTKALGFPYDRARELVDESTECMQALSAERISEIVPFVNEITHRKALKMRGRVLISSDDHYPTALSDWSVVIDLGVYRQLTKPLAKIQMVVAARRQAA